MSLPKLVIITGPPGSGKTTLAKTKYPKLPVFDTDLNNKEEWINCDADCILMTAAPSSENKTYWLSEAHKYRREPELLAILLPRMVVLQRMRNRDGLTQSTRNDLEKGIERWYRSYSRHPAEERIHSG